jgi:hypothetical protein
MVRPQRKAIQPILLRRMVELIMAITTTAENLHRGAKYFMDTGRAQSAADALEILTRFGLTIEVGPEIITSRDHQVALLTLVNCARRMFLGGVHVVALPSAPLMADLVVAKTLREAVEVLRGELVEAPVAGWPSALVGSVPSRHRDRPEWQLTWNKWRGGVTPTSGHRLSEADSCGLGPSVAAAVCAGEAFLYHAGDHPMAGRRASGVSLWRPCADWLLEDDTEPSITYLPSRLWLIGLGNLGQAYLWMLGALDYANRGEADFVLQDFDRIAESNDSTSLLSDLPLVGRMKTRAMSVWLERQGFRTSLEERRFGPYSKRAPDEPAVALCGVDNKLARSYLERAGFDWVIETGLGSGPTAFQNFSLHTFPSSLQAADLWADSESTEPAPTISQPAYSTDKHPSLDECGLAQLASRTIGVPFVGLLAAAFAIAEILRRLHGGTGFEVISGSTAALEDIEMSSTPSSVYAFGHTPAAIRGSDPTHSLFSSRNL